MKRFLFSAACCAALFAHGAQAAEVTGATLGIDYSAFTEDSGGTVDKTALSGSIELGFDRNFGLQGDLSLGRLGFAEADFTSFALHGLYHASENASVGVFIGRDVIEGDGQTFYGAEAGFEQGQLAADIYVASFKDSDVSNQMLGIGAGYNANENITIGMSHDRLDIEGIDLSRTQLEAEYRLETVTLSAQLGSADVDDLGSETYFGIGAKLAFGAKRGTTFEQRGFLSVLPGL